MKALSFRTLAALTALLALSLYALACDGDDEPVVTIEDVSTDGSAADDVGLVDTDGSGAQLPDAGEADVIATDTTQVQPDDVTLLDGGDDTDAADVDLADAATPDVQTADDAVDTDAESDGSGDNSTDGSGSGV